MERIEKKPMQNSALRAMLSVNKPEEKEKVERKPRAEKKEEPKVKRNERSYRRYRGMTPEKVETKPMSYYISDDMINAILKRVDLGHEKDKSAVVREALEMYCKVELKEIRAAKENKSGGAVK